MLIVPTNIWQVSRMTFKAFLPPHNYTPSNAYRHMDTLEYQVTFMSSHAYRHFLSPNRPGRPARIGRNPASQRHHTASPICSQMIRRDAPTSIVHFSVSHRCSRSVQRMAPVTLSAWTTLRYTGQYNHTPRIERTGEDSCINPTPKGMHNYNPLT